MYFRIKEVNEFSSDVGVKKLNGNIIIRSEYAKRYEKIDCRDIIVSQTIKNKEVR